MCEVIFQNHNFEHSMNYMIKDYKTTYIHLPKKSGQAMHVKVCDCCC